MGRCVNCDTVFTEGYNPFYCSEECAIEKNEDDSDVDTVADYQYLRDLHKQKAPRKPRKVPEKKPVSRQNLLTRPWTL